MVKYLFIFKKSLIILNYVCILYIYHAYIVIEEVDVHVKCGDKLGQHCIQSIYNDM